MRWVFLTTYAHTTRTRISKSILHLQVLRIVSKHRPDGVAPVSIGIISLWGPEQASKINEQLHERLSSEVVDRHQIKCGDASQFQGSERDIVLLSMVADDNKVAITAVRDGQSFNVAASRARNSMILFHSVTRAKLSARSAGNWRLKLLDFFESAQSLHLSDDEALPTPVQSLFARLQTEGFGTRLLTLRHGGIPSVKVIEVEGIRHGESSRAALVLVNASSHGAGAWQDAYAACTMLARMQWPTAILWTETWAEIGAFLEQLALAPLGPTSINQQANDGMADADSTMPDSADADSKERQGNLAGHSDDEMHPETTRSRKRGREVHSAAQTKGRAKQGRVASASEVVVLSSSSESE